MSSAEGDCTPSGVLPTSVNDDLLANRRLMRPTMKLSHLPTRPPVDIEFADLTYTVPHGKGSKIILRSVSGRFRSGQLTAILGPSGAGKSTLLNALAGYKCAEVTGSVSINGEPRDSEKFRKSSRYIMQEDLVQPLITVQESMMMAADLKLGLKLTREQKLTAIEEILDMLRLLTAKDTETSLLSGGEKKRLSIALELVNNPPVIFLDEPTTGLDDMSSSQCISLLKMLAQGGRTVICSIHTPSARLFAMFDHVYIVAEGQCIYQGPGTEIVPFLASVDIHCPKHYNPADFVIEVSSGEYGDHNEKMVAAVDNGRCYVWSAKPGLLHDRKPRDRPSTRTLMEKSDFNYKFESSCWMQFRVLTYRMLLQTWRDSTQMILKSVLHIFLGLIVGAMFFDFGNDASKMMFNFGFVYTCIIMFLYIPLLPVLLQFPAQVQLLKREHFNRWYSLNAYFCAMTISKLPLQFLFGSAYILMVYFMTNQPNEWYRILQFLGICLLIGLASESFGLAISSTLGVVNGMFVGPAASVPLMLLAVYGMDTGTTAIPLHIRLAMYLSYLRYGFEGLVIATYGNGRAPLICPEDEVYCPLQDPKELLKQTGMENLNFWVDVAGLLISIFVLRAICYFLLRWRLSSRRSLAAVNLIGRFIKAHFNTSA